MKREIYDVTMTIREGMVTWPGEGPVQVRRVRSMEEGERLNLTHLNFSAHTGTHVDAPVHFLRDGEGVEGLSLDVLMGPSLVVSIPGIRAIGAGELASANLPPGTERLLLKTGNARLMSDPNFSEHYAHLTLDGARYLIERGLRLVGIDYLSVAEYGKGDEVHRELLGSGVVILEGLDLREVPPGPYRMTALPLKIAGCDGAPARVVLQKGGD